MCSIAWIPFFSPFLLASLPHGARLPPSPPARSIPYHPNHPFSRLPPSPSKTSSFLLVVHRGAWIVADFLWAHFVDHSRGENSLGGSLFIFAVARDTWGKIVQLYLVHSSLDAFPPLHPLPLHLTFHSCIFLFRTGAKVYHFSHSYRGCLSVVSSRTLFRWFAAYLRHGLSNPPRISHQEIYAREWIIRDVVILWTYEDFSRRKSCTRYLHYCYLNFPMKYHVY